MPWQVALVMARPVCTSPSGLIGPLLPRVCGKGGVASLQLISHFWESPYPPSQTLGVPPKALSVCGFSQRSTGLMKPSLKHIRFEAERLGSLRILRSWGYFGGSWLHSVIHAAPPRTRFLFLEKPPLVDCGEREHSGGAISSQLFQ